MKAGKGNQTVAAVCMVALGFAAAYGAEPLYGAMKNAGKGTAVDLSGTAAQAYQVESVWQQSDGGYLVHAYADGFQSQIQMEVLFDGTGEQILRAAVVSQADTEGIGSQITGEDFAARFENVKAPVQVKDMEVKSPVSAAVTGPAGGETAGVRETESMPEWDPKDKSAEARAARALYDAGMLDTALEDRPHVMAVADLSVEDQAVAHLGQAGLLDRPVAYQAEELFAAAVTCTPIDGVAGATISSKGAATAVNNAYFFINEELK